MEPLGWHITVRLKRDQVLLPGPVEQRTWARVVLEQARDAELLAFHSPDTHGHLLLVCPRPLAGQVTREVESALQHRLDLGSGFDAARFRPVRDLWHLQRSFHYVLGQLAHHGQAPDPIQEASNLPDLLGLRPLGAWTAANVRRHLPRVDRDSLLAHLGQESLPAPADPDTLDLLLEAAASAACVPVLSSNRPEEVGARRALVAATPHPVREVARALDVHPGTLRRLRTQEPVPALVQAIRLQVAVRGTTSAPRTFGPARPRHPPSGDRAPAPTPRGSS